MKNLLTLILTKTTLGLGLLLLSALSQAQTSQVYYIHTDHLNTPRLLSDSQGRERWRWEQAEGFGSNAPNEQPTATQPKVTFNLRYPGQYFDAETATHYNYFRDYNPQTGRYTTSDPIGLNGGINTYTYVENDPLRKVDPLGLMGNGPGNGSNSSIRPPKYDHNYRPDGKPWGTGCGDRKSDRFVPDYFPKSCAAHDNCYANQCGKAVCDNNFLRDMRNERPDLPNVVPWLYYQAVDKFGDGAYNNAK